MSFATIATSPTPSIEITPSTFQDVFGDFVCGVVSDMHDYWTQFGFMDKIEARRAAMDVLDILKPLVSLSIVETPEEQAADLNDFAMDAEYIIVLP